MTPEERLNRLEPDIQNLGHQAAFGDIDLAQDLAQEGLIAAWKHLQNHPDCPDSHLINRAKRAMWHYRVKGRSVDGVLNQRDRQRKYRVIPFDPEFNPANRNQRPTESAAITSILFDRIFNLLDKRQKLAILYRLEGWSWIDVRRLAGGGMDRVYVIHHLTKEVFNII